MTALPGALFIADPIKDKIAFSEARKKDVPVIAVVDSNCNPDDIDYPIPANDDAIKAIRLVCSKIADAIIESKTTEIPTEVETTELTSTETEEPIGIGGSYTFNPEES